MGKFYTDRELAKFISKGDKVVFARFYDQYIDLLFNYGIQMINDPELVRDCLHDLFVEIWDTRNKLDKVIHLKAYLIKSLRYKLTRQIKLQHRHNRKILEYSKERFQFEVSCENIIISSQMNSELIDCLKKNVNLLSNRQREVVFHIFYHDMSHQEVATILSLTKKTVYNLLHNAIKTLRTNLQEVKALRA